MRVLFVCKERMDEYGISTGLLNSANFVANSLNKIGIDAKVVSVIDNNYIYKEVHSYKPDFVIIEAFWVVPSKFDVLCTIRPGVQWVVRSHSKIPFFANEGIAMSWMRGYKEISEKYDNFFLAFNDKETSHDMEKIFKQNIYYLPNIYHPVNYPEMPPEKKVQNHIHIGCFGAIRPLKNHLIQAVSAIQFSSEIGKKLFFHVNGSRLEQSGENVLKNLRNLFNESGHELVEHPWMSHEEFIKVVRTMDMGMQVSLTESFNIVAADFVYNKKSIVVSPEIGWLSSLSHSDPNISESIIAGLHRAMFLDVLGFKYINLLLLWNNNRKSLKEWLKFLKSMSAC